MEAKDRIIVALDVDSVGKATALVKELVLHVGFFKFGLEFINSILASLIVPKDVVEAQTNLAQVRRLFQLLAGKIFWDGKFNDIPNTVGGASAPVTKMDVKMFNVHCLGGLAMMKAAKEAVEKVVASSGTMMVRPIILGVTLLTSLNYGDLVEMRLCEEINFADPQESAAVKRERIEKLVQNLAWLAQESGLDGVVASPQEIKAIRDYCQPDFLVITPGVRPLWAVAGDQKRVMTPGEAIKAGADYLVIGRPITQPPKEIGNPVEAVKRIAEEINSALS